MSSEHPGVLERPGRPPLAYRAVAGRLPWVVFCGGFTSTMDGTKATALEAHCRRRGTAYVRFDYAGHGASGGRFEDQTVGSWTRDALAVLDRVARGPVVLVGSSMGGWVASLVIRERPDRVRGLVTVAAAPDFTAELVEPHLDPDARERLRRAGRILVPNPYGPEPTVITRQLLDDGRARRVLDGPIPLDGPARLLHGLADDQVPWTLSVRLAEALATPDARVILVKGGDHRLSDPTGLGLLYRSVDEVWAGAGGS
ncbi:alpha/beta fold hydrolase [Deferrisoma camini]|uniref:alpha/beta fold hydrolase n=1 Tax=Deferrisoma camini TaxID=1035120 RepID=UPI00046D5641|nr:alpha/beta hydrolase [Deferrisoma camini]